MTATFASPRKDFPRDHYTRPLVQPVDGGKPVAYTRVSTLAKELGNKEALVRWMQRMTALGMGLRPDLVQLAAVLDATDKQQLNAIVKQAMEAAKSSRAANLGTALHKLTEHLDAGTLPANLPGDLVPDLTAYEEAMRDVEILASEQHVVVDELRAAGTFDRLVRLPDGRVMVGDIKTGQEEPSYPHSAAIQVAIYAHGHLYDPDRGRLGHLPSLGVDQQRGLLIHLPAGKATCQLYLLDLDFGWSMAQAATTVREVFRSKPIEPLIIT